MNEKFDKGMCAYGFEVTLFSDYTNKIHIARLAQLVERKALNLVVVGSSPTSGDNFFLCGAK